MLGVFLLASDTRSGLEDGNLVARLPPIVESILNCFVCVACVAAAALLAPSYMLCVWFQNLKI